MPGRIDRHRGDNGPVKTAATASAEPEWSVGPIPEWGQDSAFGAVVSRLLPIALLVVTWVVSLITVSPSLASSDRLVPALAATGVIVILRLLGETLLGRSRPRTGVWTVAWVVHALAILVLVLLNPFACIYAFTGYIDAERFLGERAIPVAVVVTAVLCALGQSGGVEGLRTSPQIFAALVVINVLIAGAMMRLAIDRERNVEARVQAATEIARMHQQNLALQQDLMAQARDRGAAAERERLSREIHDTVAQGLVAVITQLESVPDTVDADTGRRIQRAEQSARAGLAEARRAVHALASPLLDGRDIGEALAELVRTWSDTHDIPAQFEQDGAVAGSRHGDVLIRVAQEALANVARHAGADRAAVTLTAERDKIRLDVGDDGGGFDPARIRYGHGLASMRDRVAAVGGSFDVETVPADGCTISVAVPR